MNIVDPILRYAKTRPEANAVIEADNVLTYGQLADVVRGTAAHLTALGKAPGNRVGLCLNDTAEHLVALLE